MNVGWIGQFAQPIIICLMGKVQAKSNSITCPREVKMELSFEDHRLSF